MNNQDKPMHQLRMDLNIDPRTVAMGDMRALLRQFMSLTHEQRSDVIKQFNVYKKALEYRYADFVVKVRDGRVVNDPKAIDMRWPEDKTA